MSWKSFLEGMASCIDIFGVLGPTVDLPKTDEEAFQRDLEALRSDSDAIMNDMLAAIREPQCENYVMSAAEAKALSDPHNRPRPKVKPQRLPTREAQRVFLEPPHSKGNDT